MACSDASFEKYADEEFEITIDFSENMETTEIITSIAVSAKDKSGTAASTILDGSSVEGTNQVKFNVKAGTKALSWYTITVEATTDVGSVWVFTLAMDIKE